jgi:adenylate cyclase
MRILFLIFFILLAVSAEPCTTLEVNEFVPETHERNDKVQKCGFVIDEHIIQTDNNYRNDAKLNGKNLIWFYIDNDKLYYYSYETLVPDYEVNIKSKEEVRRILKERIQSGFFVGMF